ncbi:MAG: ABC transporter permease, partial [Bacteroidetes bacterium]
MLRNYFKSSLRYLAKGKGFSFINIIGLSIGMAGSMLIILWLKNEIGFDRFHKNARQIYEVYGLTNNTDGHRNAIPVVPQPLGPTIAKDFPEIENAVRVKDIDRFLVTVGNKSVTGSQGSFVDPAFLKIFSFPLVSGNIDNQLRDINSITITEKYAKKLFGDADPIGKTIKFDSSDYFTVTGVLKDLPSNTRFNFEYLVAWDYLRKLGEGYSNESWLSNNTATYVLLKPNTRVTDLEGKIKNISRKYSGRPDIWTHFLVPLERLHLYNQYEDGVSVGGRIETVRVFAMIAAFILLIACINFMNLSTARSETRAKEVGVRKVAGAGKWELIIQFYVEAFLPVCGASVFALAISILALPFFNSLIGIQLEIPWTNPIFWIGLAGFILFTSILAGSYPALYLSSFKPVSIFKNQYKKTQLTFNP